MPNEKTVLWVESVLNASVLKEYSIKKINTVFKSKFILQKSFYSNCETNAYEYNQYTIFCCLLLLIYLNSFYI